MSNIRARGTYITGTNGTSNGLVPMLRVFNSTARYVDQGGGKRPGAAHNTRARTHLLHPVGVAGQPKWRISCWICATYSNGSFGTHCARLVLSGAFAIYLEPWHADVFEFLDLRKNTGTEENRARDLFYALWIPDLFMKRVEQVFPPSECSQPSCLGFGVVSRSFRGLCIGKSARCVGNHFSVRFALVCD